MKDIDTNKDGKISKEELLARVKFVEEFDRQQCDHHARRILRARRVYARTRASKQRSPRRPRKPSTRTRLALMPLWHTLF